MMFWGEMRAKEVEAGEMFSSAAKETSSTIRMSYREQCYIMIARFHSYQFKKKLKMSIEPIFAKQ